MATHNHFAVRGQCAEQFRRVARRNVFLSDEGMPEDRVRLKAMDHTHCLTWASNLTQRLADIDEVQYERVYGRFPEFEPWLDRMQVQKLLNELRGIKREEIMQVVQGVPVAWDVNQAARGALVNLLSQRAEWLAARLPGLLWAQQELKLESL